MYAEKSRHYYETLLRRGKSKRNQAIGIIVFYLVVEVLLLLLDHFGASGGMGKIGLYALLLVGAVSGWHYVKAGADIREAQAGLGALHPEERGEASR